MLPSTTRTLHQAAKSSRAVKRPLGPANKCTHLLVAALWETYCEDVVLEATIEMVTGVEDPDALPAATRSAMARDLKGTGRSGSGLHRPGRHGPRPRAAAPV